MTSNVVQCMPRSMSQELGLAALHGVAPSNPVCNEADIEFLTKEVSRICNILVRAQQQQHESELMPSIVSTGGGEMAWSHSISLRYNLPHTGSREEPLSHQS